MKYHTEVSTPEIAKYAFLIALCAGAPQTKHVKKTQNFKK